MLGNETLQYFKNNLDCAVFLLKVGDLFKAVNRHWWISEATIVKRRGACYKLHKFATGPCSYVVAASSQRQLTSICTAGPDLDQEHCAREGGSWNSLGAQEECYLLCWEQACALNAYICWLPTDKIMCRHLSPPPGSALFQPPKTVWERREEFLLLRPSIPNPQQALLRI